MFGLAHLREALAGGKQADREVSRPDCLKPCGKVPYYGTRRAVFESCVQDPKLPRGNTLKSFSSGTGLASDTPLQSLQHSFASAPRVNESAPEWLIDNAEAYDRMLQAIASARRSVWMTQLAFDADCVAYANEVPGDSPPPGGGRVLAEALVAAVVQAPIDVRILLNATLLLDTARPLRRFFAARLGALNLVPGTVRIRGLSRFPQLLHCKMVVVDGEEAFLLGSPFANGYWDDPRHRPVDARRPLRELGGRPLHDVSVRLTGRPVTELQRIFAELWTVTASDSAPDQAPDSIDSVAGESAACFPRGDAHAESTAAPVRIVCTSPAGLLPSDRRGATQIIDALLEGIAGARSLIYVEHQYLSARPVVVGAGAGAASRAGSRADRRTESEP